MSIRRIQYQIDFIHILTFNQEYRSAINGFFPFEKLEYGIDNENTLLETARLIFKAENMAIILRKEAITFFYEGEIKPLKESTGPLKIFWDLFEKVKKFKDFNSASRHNLILHAVDLKNEDQMKSISKENPYLKQNPFGELSEFACVYEFTQEKVEHKLQIGNFSKKDIKPHELRFFKTEYNSDLLEGIGIMGRLELSEMEKSPTYSKMKSLLIKGEKVFSQFNLLDNASE